SHLGGGVNKGAVAIAFALTLPVLAICTAVAVNLGMCYLTEEQLQMALDAAASVLATTGVAPFQEPQGVPYWDAQLAFAYTFCAYPAAYTACSNSWRFQPRLNGSQIHYTGFDGYGRLHITAYAYAPLMSLWGVFPTQQRIVANSVVVFAQSGSGKK
ncbi:MAG: hypothetical protein J6P38_00200, partial [Acetobacter sp.]|nr:hypothetical protein [Acetobacter sp.]